MRHAEIRRGACSFMHFVHFKKRVAFLFKVIGAKRHHHFKHEAHFNERRERFMTKNIIVDLSMDFAVSVVTLCDGIKGKSSIVNQLLRSGTSIGANIHEANYASSRADFIAKMQIALKECYETEYWLELFVRTRMIPEAQYKNLKSNCGKIRKLLIASINTAKTNSEK